MRGRGWLCSLWLFLSASRHTWTSSSLHPLKETEPAHRGLSEAKEIDTCPAPWVSTAASSPEHGGDRTRKLSGDEASRIRSAPPFREVTRGPRSSPRTSVEQGKLRPRDPCSR